MIKGLTTDKALKKLYYMLILFWVSTTFFQLVDLFTDHFIHWYISGSIFCMWLTICVFSHLTKVQLRKERDILNEQHEERMNELRTMNPKL